MFVIAVAFASMREGIRSAYYIAGLDLRLLYSVDYIRGYLSSPHAALDSHFKHVGSTRLV